MNGEMLVLAHTPNDAKQIEAHLRGAGHNVHVLVAPGLDSFSDMIAKSDICVAIYDAEFTEGKLIQAIEAVHRSKPNTPVLQLSGHPDPRSTTEAMRLGVRGVISLSNLPHLDMQLQQEYETWSLHQELQAIRNKIADLETVRTHDLGSTSAPGLRIQEGIVVHANQALAQALNIADPEDLIGYPLMDLVASADQTTVKNAVKKALKGRAGSEEDVSFTLQSESGASQHVEARFIQIEHDGDPALEIRAKEAVATSSGDTGLDRQALITAIHQQAKTKADNAVQTLIFVSIDDFSDIEKRAGYAGAEEVTAQTISLLRENISASDNLFRFSLSEIIILGQRETLLATQEELEHMQRSLARHIFNAGDKEVSCTVSVVVYPLSKDPEDPQQLLSKIHDESLDLQAAGGNVLRITGDTAEELNRQAEQMQWVSKVEAALKENRFDLAFQNIASLAGEERQFSDILLRMIDETGQEVLARHFMPPAEQHGLLPQIDRWVFERAGQVIEEELKQSHDPCFFVRVAESTLSQSDQFITWLQDFAGKHEAIKGHMVIVIREAHLQDHLKRAQALVNAAKALGLETALDHFGANRMSHELLGRLQVNYVKLHADFTQSIGKTGAEMQALEAIMEHAKQHKVKTIAERVQDANGMARLWQLGVNYIMGSHVHEPERELKSTRFELV
ncbi:MAG: EAL domain-containing protein [Oceanococcus sp.]